jgi:RNA polymerase sigma-70 factor (sigma-E family)
MQKNMTVDKPVSPGARAPDATDIDDLVAGLHREHALALVRLANLLVRDQQTAEDVVQEAFLKLYRAMPRLIDHAQILPYLRVTVINQARSILRSRKRTWLQRVLHEPPGGSAESAVIDRAERDEVMAAVARLPRRAREVLVLRYYAELQDSEIATVLGISRGTVSSTASRALAALSLILKEES